MFDSVRLTRSVLAEKRMNLTTIGLEVHLIVCDDARKAFGHTTRGEGRSDLRRPGPAVTTCLGLAVAHPPVADPSIPLTSQSMDRISSSVIFVPSGTRSLPAWSSNGPVSG